MFSDDPHERFTRLLIQHEPVLLRCVLVAVPNRADARDILQECSVALWRHFTEYDSTRPFSNWALGFVRMEVRRFLRTAQRRTQLTERAAQLLFQDERDHERQIEERDHHLRDCLNALPGEHRELIDRYYRDEEPVASVAEKTGRSLEAVYKTIQRVRLALHRCIELKMLGAER